jgi:hypothetical protein
VEEGGFSKMKKTDDGWDFNFIDMRSGKSKDMTQIKYRKRVEGSIVNAVFRDKKGFLYEGIKNLENGVKLECLVDYYDEPQGEIVGVVKGYQIQ